MAKRRSGKPKRSERVVTPELLQQINRDFLQGVPQSVIAERIGIAKQTLSHHIARLRELWKEEITTDKETQIAKINMLYAIACEQIESRLPVETVKQIKETSDGTETILKRIRGRGKKAWADLALHCLQEINRIEGHYREPGDDSDDEPRRFIPIVVSTPADAQRLPTMRITLNNGVVNGEVIKQHQPAANGNGHANGHFG